MVQGEYVDFSITKTTSGDHEYQAVDVHGIKGGKLMCETRHELKISRTSYKSEEQQTETKMPRQQRVPRDSSQPRTPRVPRDSSQPRVRGEGPRDSEKKEWTLVSNKDTEKTKKVHTIRRTAPRQGANEST